MVVINEMAGTAGVAPRLKYDIGHDSFVRMARKERNALLAGEDDIRLQHEPAITAPAWRGLSANAVLHCTDVYGKIHLAAGAKKAPFSHPGGSDPGAKAIYNTSHQQPEDSHRIASCTKNCIIPMIKLTDDANDIGSAMIILPTLLCTIGRLLLPAIRIADASVRQAWWLFRLIRALWPVSRIFPRSLTIV